jgi:hypothetical protein
LKSCTAVAQAAAVNIPPSSVDPAPTARVVVTIPPLTSEEWCAGVIRKLASQNGALHAAETAKAVCACAPLLGPWLDERESVCFIMAVIWKESTFNPDVTGASHDRGLMQLVDRWHKWRYGGKDWREPAVNVRAGTGLLAEKMKKYHGSLDKVLTSYNGSRSYVAPVMKKYRTLLKMWDAASPTPSQDKADVCTMDRL